MSLTLVDQITLDCLMNKDTVGTHVVKQLEKQVEQERFQEYKERVITLFQQLANQEDPCDLTPDVKYAYYSFVKSAIGFFVLAEATTDDDDDDDDDEDTSNRVSSCDLEGDYDEDYASSSNGEYGSSNDYDLEDKARAYSSHKDATRSVKMNLTTLDSFVTRIPRHNPFAVKKSV